MFEAILKAINTKDGLLALFFYTFGAGSMWIYMSMNYIPEQVATQVETKCAAVENESKRLAGVNIDLDDEINNCQTAKIDAEAKLEEFLALKPIETIDIRKGEDENFRVLKNIRVEIGDVFSVKGSDDFEIKLIGKPFAENDGSFIDSKTSPYKFIHDEKKYLIKFEGLAPYNGNRLRLEISKDTFITIEKNDTY